MIQQWLTAHRRLVVGTALAVTAATLLLAASAVSAVLRSRRSQSVARQQMKWLALAALFLILIAGITTYARGALGTPPGTGAVLITVCVALVLAGAAIGILRHRRYDVDVVLNQTIVFGLLAVFITALYATIIVGVGSLIGDRSNLLLSVGTTALVAAAFEPTRARVQHWANLAVYGHRATPYETLAAIADEMGSNATGDPLRAMAALLADSTGAAHATIWVHLDGELRAAACWPAHDPQEHPIGTVDDDPTAAVPEAAHSEPVRLDGDLLGVLSFDRVRDEPVVPHERRLVAEMAGQAALVLGNARLRTRLQARLEELRASRQRLVAAQDETRRKLERNLHDGAQQQLVALKIKLGLARTIAAKEAAGEAVTELLEDLSTTSDEAVDALRSLARGIYPPLLEAEGLERAITTQAQKSPVPVTVRAHGLRRYEREVEATVYFCVLEALNNAVKHAHATEFDVLVKDHDDHLSFRVTDDGKGFDPQTVMSGLGLTNMADRVDALGGSVTIDAVVGGGVRVLGAIPVPSVSAVAAQVQAVAV